VLERVTTQGLERDLAGRTVTAVHPHGKHLMIDLDDGTQLRAHLGMNGRVRSYARAEGESRLAKLSPGRVTLVLVTQALVVMWINARTIEVAPRRAPMRGLAVAALGPDVLAGDFDPQLAASRALAHASQRIADVLLDQRVAAGIGNIWKCESLFARGIDPRTRVADLTADDLAALYTAARELMLRNLAPGSSRDRLAVYSKTGQPCPRCSSIITAYQLGDPPRWTWSCPRCQPPGGSRGASS
jgi:endonuclease-8